MRTPDFEENCYPVFWNRVYCLTKEIEFILMAVSSDYPLPLPDREWVGGIYKGNQRLMQIEERLVRENLLQEIAVRKYMEGFNNIFISIKEKDVDTLLALLETLDWFE